MSRDNGGAHGCLSAGNILVVVQIVLIILKAFKLITVSWAIVCIPSFIYIGLLAISAIWFLVWYLKKKIR